MNVTAEIREEEGTGSQVQNFLDREAATDTVRQFSKKSIELAWILADIASTQAWSRWGFRSFLQWVKADVAHPTDHTKRYISAGYAFQLRDVGVIFSKQREAIMTLARERKTGIVTLLRLASQVKNGMPVAHAVAFLLEGTPIPEQFAHLSAEEEGVHAVTTLLPAGDYDNFQKTLVLYAIMNGYSSTNDALQAMVLSEYVEMERSFNNNEMFQRFHLPHQGVVYADLINENKFYCALCGKLPVEPNIHHMVPVSMSGGDFGPRALLCGVGNCHSIVQAKWKEYCEEWIGKGSVDRLLKEAADAIEKHGNFNSCEQHTVLTGTAPRN
jgi:hypothetical protein